MFAIPCAFSPSSSALFCGGSSWESLRGPHISCFRLSQGLLEASWAYSGGSGGFLGPPCLQPRSP
eukprot:6340512-Pyramimonas_sp.AAC.1